MLEKFDSVESVLFWFCKCKMLRYDLLQKNSSGVEKVCSIDDVEIILNRLILSRNISKDHIKVLKKYSDQSIIPAIGIDDDNDVFLWKNLIDILFPIFLKKGFLRILDDVKKSDDENGSFEHRPDFKDLQNKFDAVTDSV